MELEVDSTRLKASAESFMAAARVIEGELSALTVASTSLTVAWVGDAADAYRVAYRDFVTGFREQYDALYSAGSALEDLADEYSAADIKGADAIPH